MEMFERKQKRTRHWWTQLEKKYQTNTQTS
jgi:hypothetical protein